MRSLATVLVTLVGVLYLLGIADASVIPRGIGEIQGWCCSSDCSVCNDGSVHCHDGDHQTCFDLTGFNEIITNTCCFLETEVDANGLEKHYTRSTGKEVAFLASPEVASVDTPTRSTEEKRGWCCNRNCDTCKADSPPCSKDDQCDGIPVFHSPQIDTCCQLDSKLRLDGTLDFTTVTGEEVKFIDSEDGPSEPTLVDRSTQAVSDVSMETARKKNLCCASDCRTCYGGDIHCLTGTECHDVATVDGPDMHTCCLIITKLDASGAEKPYTLGTGKEVKILPSPTKDLTERDMPEPAVAIPSSDPPADPPRGWCCLSGCNACLHPPSCVYPDYICDRSALFNNCCMLERHKNQMTGVEKYYTPITSEEVTFVDSEEEYLALSLTERVPPPVSVNDLEKRAVPPEPPMHTVEPAPRGWCCITSGCNICTLDPVCRPPNYKCGSFEVCCMLELRKNEITGEEKYHAPITGDEVIFIDSAEEYLALSASLSDQGPVPTTEAPMPALAERQAQGDLPSGFCCLPGCSLCYQACTPPDYECDPTTPLFNTCCMAELRKDVNGAEKYHNPITGIELKFVDGGGSFVA